MILLAPWAKRTTTGTTSPKDYPWWPEVVQAFPARVTQISCRGEPAVPGCAARLDDCSIARVEALLKETETFMSVDSFLPHLAWALGRRGVVVFGPSDPIIFGHMTNINLLKSRECLRARQFGLWAEETWKPELFVPPGEVIQAVQTLLL